MVDGLLYRLVGGGGFWSGDKGLSVRRLDGKRDSIVAGGDAVRGEGGFQFFVHQAAEVGKVRGDHGASGVKAAGVNETLAHANDFWNTEMGHVAAFDRAFGALGDDPIEAELLDKTPG